ncbi:protein kinase, partial [bacterium]|nr:protein kinase [bacterium]
MSGGERPGSHASLARTKGDRLGAYSLLDLLGRGGMGEVWKGVRVDLPEVREIELVREHEPPFLVMELARGESARAMLRSRGALPAEIALVIFSQVLDAMEHAHKRGVVHRDLKPENVIVEPSELVVKVTDFGLGTANEEALGLLLSKSVLSLGADSVSGTLEYMPPEQRKGGARAEPTLDVYALGVLLYEFLTGELPLGAFRLPTEVDRTFPTTLDRIVERALAPKASHRFSDAGELSRSLRKGLEREGFRLERRDSPPGKTTPVPRAEGPSRKIAIKPAAPPRSVTRTVAVPPASAPPAPAIPLAAPASPRSTTRARRRPRDLQVCEVQSHIPLPADEAAPALRAHLETVSPTSAIAPEISIFLVRDAFAPGEEVEGTITIRWPIRHALRSVRFRARSFVRTGPGRVALEASLAGERPRGLSRDIEAVLVGDRQPLSLAQRLSDAIRSFSGIENALSPGEHDVTFALALPRGTPPTFAGATLSVAHAVIARLDVPLGFDVDAIAEVVVRPAGEVRSLRSIPAPGPRSTWIALAGATETQLEVSFGYDDPQSVPPVELARLTLVREEEIVRGERVEARRTVLARGIVPSHAPVRANRVSVEVSSAEVASFDV